ncbi:suppressor of glycerol defect protein 1 [Diaporthe helianthi]|uniref:Suppressor of glycerol defect protein 1 n=1 Tax=Diaporthe helianthi TaxID=158607 RepID=A0A2P5HRR9_DIAHE|nr:suppressor of glycerol defect protein 1 [Diaporthe helianthi]
MPPSKKRREPLRPSLPADLLKELGNSAPTSSAARRSSQAQTRKDRRKEERCQKRRRDNIGSRRRASNETLPHEHPAVGKASKPTKRTQHTPDDDEFGGFSEESADESSDGEDLSMSSPSGMTESKRARHDTKSPAIDNKLAEDDAEIAFLEKKLGIKSRKTLPKSFQEDGLDEVLGELAEQEDDEALLAKKKRKAEADEWLAQKRRKATQHASKERGEEENDDEDNLELGSDLDDESDLDDDEDSFGSEHEMEEAPVRKRENPYVAPVPATAAAQNYVPPARRQDSGSDAELVSRIRRQAQGFINRLTDSNLIAILGDIERLYREHPRQHITSVLVDLILVQACEPTSLPDTLLILYAGFSTAVYKVIGPDVGAQLIQQTVDRFRTYYAGVSKNASSEVSKQTSNLITFLAQTYNFQLIRCNLIFDYVRFLLDDLSELNAELLLRIVRMAGQNLRRDDPLALKDIVALVRQAVNKAGESNLSVRTKFMIESINDLKNNKAKTGASGSAVIQDHTTRMKKILGSLSTRKLKATEPLRIGLKDMEESDTRGKWWLVGASWAGRDGPQEKPAEKEPAGEDGDGGGSREKKNKGKSGANSMLDEDEVPDLAALAREQNMNTDVRRAIFVAIVGAVDYEDAYRRVKELRLTQSGQRRDVAYVAMHCAGIEESYNPYYSWVARRLCEDKRIRFAFQEGLWNLFGRLGELLFGEVDEAKIDDKEDEEDEGEATGLRRIFCLGKMFGFMVAHGTHGLGVLKCLNLLHLKSKTSDFVEVMLITLLQELKVLGREPTATFAAVPDRALSKGLEWFLRTRVRKTKLLTSKKEKKVVKRACDKAIAALANEEHTPVESGSP